MSEARRCPACGGSAWEEIATSVTTYTPIEVGRMGGMWLNSDFTRVVGDDNVSYQCGQCGFEPPVDSRAAMLVWMTSK